MRSVVAMLAFGLVGLLIFPAVDTGRAEPPAALPDMYITNDDIKLEYRGEPTDAGLPGALFEINVTVHNAGPGNSTSANVSLFIDGSFVAIQHVMQNLSSTFPGNESVVYLAWATGSAAPGNHTVLVTVNDTNGDRSEEHTSELQSR